MVMNGIECCTSIPSSSCSSRASASCRDSPSSTLPPGNSQRPPWCLWAGRWLSRISPWGLRTIAATTSSRSVISGPVFGVDLDVVVAEVAGPDGIGGIAGAERHANSDIRLRHHCRTLLFRVAVDHATVAHDLHVTEPDIDACHIQLSYRCATDCRKNAAPLRVRGKQRGFHQR